jgi:predicted DNA-binding protein
VPDELWDRFGELTAQAGTDRSAVLRELIAWYVRHPSGKLPNRP